MEFHFHGSPAAGAKRDALNIATQENRDQTADELNAQWAVDRLNEFAEKPGDQPFFMGVGFIRPHTPLVVPQRFFDRFPLDSIELPEIKEGDIDDTFAPFHPRKRRFERTEFDNAPWTWAGRLYQDLVASYDTREEALKRFIQAYLASVASVDEVDRQYYGCRGTNVARRQHHRHRNQRSRVGHG